MTEFTHEAFKEADAVNGSLLPATCDHLPQSVPDQSRFEGFTRRAFDIVFASCVLLFAAPMIAIAAIAIRAETPGSPWFRQTRMGIGGRSFSLVKLRGMMVDASERYPELYAYENVDPSDSERFYFRDDEPDPRVTRVGRLLRRHSIDELPNFWNVLRGDMSVVGPRPEIPELADHYGSRLNLMLSVKPGVTSPAKALGRDTLSLEETLRMDLDYIQNRTLSSDLKVVVDTALGIISGKNRSA